jgi:hypothetical protein
MPRRVADEEDPVLGRRPQRVGDPVALIAAGLDLEIGGEAHRRLAHVEARVKRADADPDLAVGGERPSVAGGDEAAVDPHLQVVTAAEGVDLQPAREQRVGRLDVVAEAERPPPAEAVDDQRRPQRSAVGDDDVAAALDHRRGLEGERALVGEQPAQRPVVERRERPRQVVAGRRVGRVDDELVEGLLQRLGELQRLQPAGRDRAGGGLALADLVAIDHHDVGAAARQLACDREPGEARAADEHVAVAVQGGARVSALGGPTWHDRGE